ncbi:hypothetical protein JCM10207_008728 [Rhodosporidiobolus poonsookiae]
MTTYAIPPDHPPIPTTSSSPFPTVPPPSCPMSALARTRPSSPTPTATPVPESAQSNPYAGQTFTLGTRNSKLAMVQAEIVAREIEQRWPGCQVRIYGMTTLGDNVLTQPLYTFGGKALWTKELEVCLLEGSVDAIVHCLKDIPTEFPPGCELGAVMEREDPSDALVVREGLPYTSLEELPEGSVIGTSSVRRVAQLRRMFPGFKFADVRGNVGTRLKKLDDPNNSYTALILASAGLIRLGLGHRITQSVTSPFLYHAVGQGALGLEIRANDPRATAMIGSLECWKTSWRTRAERMMLRILEGGCSVPVGCETKITEVWVKGGEGDETREDSSDDEKPSARERRRGSQAGTEGAISPLTKTQALLPQPLSPPPRANGASLLPSPSPVRPSPLAAPNGRSHSSTSANGLSLSLSNGTPLSPTLSATSQVEIDETQGIPAGHPAVNPAAICPVTGRRLPSPPPAAIAHTQHCTHRPGSPPLNCPLSARANGAGGASHHATLELTGTITSLSGTSAVIVTLRRRVHSVEDCEVLGAEVARELIEGGGKEILTELGRHVKEVGGGEQAHDGKEIPFVVPGGANSHPALLQNGNGMGLAHPPAETNGHANGHVNGGTAPIPVECPVHPDHGANGFATSPNGAAAVGLSKSPHSLGHRTVFKEGEKCLRPAGW